ncbi:MAG: Crp/Fnr family transcriptional regulator [Niabella sp.]
MSKKTMYLLDVLSQTIRVDDAIEAFILEQVDTRLLEKGAPVGLSHALDRNIYFVESGLLRSFYNEDGKDITLGFIKEAGFAASKEALFLQKPSRSRIEALEPSVINYMSFEKLQKFAETSISISRLMISVMGTLAINMEYRIYALQYMSAKERYQQMMEEAPDILLRAPLGMVASYLGMSQETLSRIRK